MSRTERTYYLVLALYHASWSFLGPVYPLFLLSRGLDLFQVNVVLAVYFATSLVFEVPTGAVADRFGRRTSFLAGCLLRAAAFTFYWRCASFEAFLLAEFVDAIGSTLESGALDAWVVDGMRGDGGERPAGRVFSNGSAIARTAMILSGLAGGYLAEIEIGLPWLFGATGFLVTAAAGGLTMEERAPAERHGEHASLVETVRDGFAAVRDTRTLRVLVALTALTAFAHLPAMVLWPPRVAEIVGRETRVTGWIWGFVNLAAIVANLGVSRIPSDVRPGLIVGVVTALRAIALAVAASASGLGGVIGGILVLEGGFSATEPLLQASTSRQSTASRRATILSFREMSFTAGSALGLLALGFVSRTLGISTTWLLAGSMLALAAPMFLRLDVREAAEEEPRPRAAAAGGEG